MTFDDMWKSLEERDTTGKYKQAREMAELGTEQLEFAYNSGYADAKSKYERQKGTWITVKQDTMLGTFEVKNKVCNKCNHATKYEYPFCPWCGADMGGKEDAK